MMLASLPPPPANGLLIKQANTRTDQANLRTDAANARTTEANARTTEANIRTDQANARTVEANTRTGQADWRTQKVETQSAALRASELRYRRLFESARDGILILDLDTGRITDVNPFLIELLGFSHDEMVGKTIGELSPFKDTVSNQAMMERLQKDGFVRYEDLPLETKDGRHIAVEFVSNVYQAGDVKVIQCNIRDISGRKQAEAAIRQRTAELEHFHRMSVGRELEMIELKKEVNELARLLGRTPPYDMSFLEKNPFKKGGNYD